MVIDLRTILRDPRHFDYSLEPAWWQIDEGNDQILGLEGPLKVQISISRDGSKFALRGRLLGGLQVRCARCLELYVRDLRTDFRWFLATVPSDTWQSELELLEDDMSIDFITGNEIDLDDIVRGQIYLSLPMKPLCHTDCYGLCSSCGANLNTEACACRQEKGHPGFSKLKNLKFKGE
jgi:uncharacterized protein